MLLILFLLRNVLCKIGLYLQNVLQILARDTSASNMLGCPQWISEHAKQQLCSKFCDFSWWDFSELTSWSVANGRVQCNTQNQQGVTLQLPSIRGLYFSCFDGSKKTKAPSQDKGLFANNSFPAVSCGAGTHSKFSIQLYLGDGHNNRGWERVMREQKTKNKPNCNPTNPLGKI